jgi:hypothetical protein
LYVIEFVSDTVNILLSNETLYNKILESSTKLSTIFETSVVGLYQMEKAMFRYCRLLYESERRCLNCINKCSCAEFILW